MDGLIYSLKDHSGYCVKNRLWQSQEWSQGDQQGTTAIT